VKGDIKSRLELFRQSGELKSGRQFAAEQINNQRDHLFPGEGREEETAFGLCYMRELKFPLEHRHGDRMLGGLLSCCSANLSLPARSSNLDLFDPCKALFLDIETTGLAGGTGTWAFLIGVGRVEEDTFLLRQYFLRRPAEERAILSHFATEAAAFPTLITFNGKLFDLPLIQTRQLLSGFRQTEPELHLDLLHCARLLWKNRLKSRSLRSLEESLLGLHRYDDIPGAEIPAVYFDYLRRGKTDQLKVVFRHNVLDILSMVTLLERIALLGSGSGIEHPAEALALGRLCLSAGRTAEGLSYLKAAAAINKASLSVEASLELARCLKKEGSWPEAASIWQGIVDDGSANLTAYVELAKYYEHRRRDYLPAHELTAKALALSEKAHGRKAGGELGKEALSHRLKRLGNKMQKTGHQIIESADSRFCSGLTLPDKVITNSSSSAPELSSGRLSGLKSEPAADA
jgi:uncharacterized protein